MMRPMTCLSLLAALGSGMYLYQEKHNAQMLDRDITRTVKTADQARDRIGLLKAEWALLNEPERLQALAASHLQLASLAPTQFARLEDLPGRLPVPSAIQVNTPPVDDVVLPMPTPQQTATTMAQASPTPAISGGSTQTASAQRTATAAVPNSPVARAAATPVPAARAVPPIQIASAIPAPKPAQTRAAKPHEADPASFVPSGPASRSLYAPVMPAYSPAPFVVHAPTVQTASAMAPPAPFVGSALGMAHTTLAAPVPFAPTPVASTVGFNTVR